VSIQIGILRHAVAEDESASGTDFDRRITHAGRLQLEQHLELLSGWGWSPSIVFHSPLVRTTQTAQTVAAHFPGLPLFPSEVVAVGDLSDILRLCVGHVAPLLVGHEPTMGELVAYLLGAPPGSTPVDRAGFALLDVTRLPTTRPARLRLFAPPRPVRLVLTPETE
jgi:phosphohistidine phosphatase